MKYSYDDIHNGICTPKQYYDSLETARDLVVGGVYKNCVGDFSETEYTIVYIGHGVALGVETFKGVVGASKYQCKLGKTPDTMTFHAKGFMAGWKVDDSRSCYRLRNTAP